MTDKSRRDFVVGASVAAGAAALGSSAEAQMRQPQRQIDPSALRAIQNNSADSLAINPQARAMMPGGTPVDRAEILTRLGLNPNTPPDAWLAIVGCGVNASALSSQQIGVLDRAGVTNSMRDIQRPLNNNRGRKY